MKNLAEGSTYRNLIGFAVPILLGNILQLTYNAADSVIVGRCAGEQALAAVGISNPVMSIIILGASGLSIGASAFMGTCYGAEKYKEVKKAFASAMVMGVLLSFLILGVSLVGYHPLLRFLKVPDEIYDLTGAYLKIILFSFPFTFLYNIITAALRSIGDSRTPIWFLALSCGVNVVLDLLFVGKFGMSVIGAGLSTLIAEGISCILCMIYVYKKMPILALGRKEWKPDTGIIRIVLKNGGVTALQQLMQPIGKILIQGCINQYGVSVIAAFNAVNRVDDFACIPEQSISHAMMTYISQSVGAGNQEKKKEGFRKGLVLEVLYGILIFLVVFLFAQPIIHIFGSGKMADIGANYLRCIAIFYILPGVTNGIQGYFRGIQKMKITLISTCIQISLRTIFVYTLVPHIGMNGAAYACAIGWSVMILYQIYIYRKMKRNNQPD